MKISHENNHKYFELKTVAIENAEDKTVGKLITLIDITERKRIQESLNFLATTDSMTGLYNRSHFMNLANTKVETCGDDDCFSLLMMDIDKFKKINDTWGHAAGDAVLRHVGKMSDDMLKLADKAMYESKSAGRNRLTIIKI